MGISKKAPLPNLFQPPSANTGRSTTSPKERRKIMREKREVAILPKLADGDVSA